MVKILNFTDALYNALEHKELYATLPTAGKDKMPVLESYRGDIPNRLVAFPEAYAKKDFDCGVHFFITDRLFIQVLRNPQKYLPFFQRCKAVIGTDLSQYANMPADFRYKSALINRAFSAYLQSNGVNVIPNYTWSLNDSLDYSIAGMPVNSVIAINCNGVMKHDYSKFLWYRGYYHGLEALQPRLIIRYGSIMPFENHQKSIYFENNRLKMLRDGSKRIVC